MISSTQAWCDTSPTVLWPSMNHGVTGNSITISSTQGWGHTSYSEDIRRLERARKRAAQRVAHWEFIHARSPAWEDVNEPDPVIMPRRILVPRYRPRTGLGLRNWHRGFRREQ